MKILLIILIIFTISINTIAEINPGKISGQILDGINRSNIDNANVILIGTDLGAASNLDGRFSIDGIPPGTYHLQASALGYASHSKTEVSVLPGKTTEIKFLLEPTAVKGKDVVVSSGFFNPNTSGGKQLSFSGREGRKISTVWMSLETWRNN